MENKINTDFIELLLKIHKHFATPDYNQRLMLDLAMYGNCFEEEVKFKWWQKIIRKMRKLPTDRRRVDPRKIRVIKS